MSNAQVGTLGSRDWDESPGKLMEGSARILERMPTRNSLFFSDPPSSVGNFIPLGT